MDPPYKRNCCNYRGCRWGSAANSLRLSHRWRDNEYRPLVGTAVTFRCNARHGLLLCSSYTDAEPGPNGNEPRPEILFWRCCRVLCVPLHPACKRTEYCLARHRFCFSASPSPSDAYINLLLNCSWNSSGCSCVPPRSRRRLSVIASATSPPPAKMSSASAFWRLSAWRKKSSSRQTIMFAVFLSRTSDGLNASSPTQRTEDEARCFVNARRHPQFVLLVRSTNPALNTFEI